MDEHSEIQYFRFRDTRHERLYKLLKLVGIGPSEYFKDACRLMDTKPAFESTTHLIGHLIREIESSLRAVLLVFAESSQKPKNDGHNWEIRQITAGLDIPEDNQIVLLWLKNAPTLAHGRAHRDNLLPPRPIDKDFLQYFDEMLSIFDFILKRFEAKYLAIHTALDKKLLIENPTREDAKWLKINVPNNQATLGYFFGKLNNAAWLEPLQTEGFFNRPPEPVYEPEKNSTFFPTWAISRFLVRMAALDLKDVKSKVGEIILEIETTNFIIHLDIADAACLLPIEITCQIAKKEAEWLQRQQSIDHLIPEKFANLTVYLADGGQAEHALEIARIVLDFVQKDNFPLSEVENLYNPEPITRMSNWDYGQFVSKCWRSLSLADWEGSLKLFCALLDEYLKYKYPNSIENGKSYSYIWHRDIEHIEDQIPNLLVSTIRQISEETLSGDDSTLFQIIEILKSQSWDIFERIILYLLRLYPTNAKEEIRKRILSKDYFYNIDFFREYVLLLETYFEDLDDENQQKVLSWIDESVPTIEDEKKKRLEWDGTELTDEDAEKSIRWRKLKWLAPLKDVLPEDGKNKYSKWTAELGQPDHPGYLISDPQITWGFEEPVSEILSQFDSVEEIREHLSKHPTDRSETPQALSRELSRLVEKDIEKFISESEKFENLEPIFVRGFLSGAHSGIQSIPENSWHNLFHLIHWAMEQPPAEADLSVDSYDSVDANWQQTRAIIGDFISSALSEEALKLPFALHTEIWKIIYSLTEDPNPTPEYEERYGGENMDPLTVSLNTIRGNAFHTLFKYIYWCQQKVDGDEFKWNSEILKVLESHLDPEIDSSLAVRAVYGERIPFLVSLDPDWVRKHLSKIFPVEKEKSNFLKAAWETFIIYTRPWDNVFDILKDEYEKAIDRIGDNKSLYRSENSKNRLAEHLITLYARGKIGIEDGGILDKFYANASDQLSAHIFWFVGRIVRDSNDIPQEVFERIIRLVNSRIANGQTHPIEMKSFGWLFTSGKFDSEWSLIRLRDTLEISSSSDPDHSIMETLSGLAAAFPRLVTECITFLVDGTDTEWKIQYWIPHIRTAISSAIEGGEIKMSEVLVNKLAARGFVDLRELLSISSSLQSYSSDPSDINS